MRRHRQQYLRGWSLALLLMPFGGFANAEEVLTVVTWGGPYEQSQKTAFFDPFEQETGIKIKTIRYNGGIDILKTREC